MTEKTPPWWRSFAGKRRKAARESASILEQEIAEKSKPVESGEQAKSSREEASDDRYDDSAVQPTFSETSNRRNLRVSRSGRFKEKRRDRGTLPPGYGTGDEAGGAREGANAPK